MANLISDEQRNVYQAAFKDIHDTFSRKAIVYKTPKRIVLSTTPDYNFMYTDAQEALDVQYIPVSGEINVRVKWLNPAELKGIKDIKEEIHGNIVRLKIHKDDLYWFDDWKRVEIDGKVVQYFGTSQPHGLFEPNFYTVYLEQSE
jgi:hypothetical protein